MPVIKRLSPRKEPIQARSIALRNSILEAATYVLKRDGAMGFTTNKVAVKAGVNIASLYQYYPNKEALLFHLIELDWAKTYAAVYPILEDENLSHRKRLHRFVENFFKLEAQDAQLKQTMADAGVFVEGTKEYRRLWSKGHDVFCKFLAGRRKYIRAKEVEADAEFIQHLITSFSEKKIAKEWPDLRRDAQIIAEMLCAHFNI